MCKATRILLLILTASASAQDNPVSLLKQVAAKATQSIDSLGRYMCTQTIVREQYEPKTPKQGGRCDDKPGSIGLLLNTADRLRLDVARTSTGEMYSWVGEEKFNDREL